MDFKRMNDEILPLSQSAMQGAQARWDALAKPLGSLGRLEDTIVTIAGLIGSTDVRLNKRGVLVFCADNGVVEEGVTQAGQEITALIAGSIAEGVSSVNQMARIANADVVAIDMGMASRVDAPRLLDRRIAPGTKNITREPAMTRAETERAIEIGVELVKAQKKKGYSILLTGEMGIGNTTTASAVASVLLNKDPAEVTGVGAGLSFEGLQRKIGAIKRAIALHRPDACDSLGVLASLGGFDIAGMAGAFLGGALYRVPVMIDGLISAVAALVACRLCPAVTCALIPSHCSAEPAAHMVLEAIGVSPFLKAGMRLGEGTGAVALLPLLDMALAVYHGLPTFGETGMQDYTPQEGYRCSHSS